MEWEQVAVYGPEARDALNELRKCPPSVGDVGQELAGWLARSHSQEWAVTVHLGDLHVHSKGAGGLWPGSGALSRG